MKLAMRLGKTQADCIISLIRSNKNPHTFSKERNVVTLFNLMEKHKNKILTRNGGEMELLQCMIEQTILEYRALREVAIEKDFRPLHAQFDGKAHQ